MSLDIGGGQQQSSSANALSSTDERLMRRLLNQDWLTKRPSLKMKYRLELLGVLARKAKLFSHQSSLPPLPVPPLLDTCTKYLATVKPLMTPEEYAQTESCVREFMAPGGVGEMLQNKLIERAKNTPQDSSWLEQWWETYGYLARRDPLPLSSNWYGLCANKHGHTQVMNAAMCVKGLLEFKTSIEQETLQPTRMLGTVPLCMYQYTRLFGTTRVPGLEVDELVTVRDSKHIAVLHENEVWLLDVYHPGDGLELTLQELEQQLEAILQSPKREAQSIATLTAANRTNWAKNRRHLMDIGNAQSIRAIESALFVLVLETREGWSDEEDSHLSMHGYGLNRWFDKSFQLIISPSGKASQNAEHAFADAMPVSHCFDVVMATNNKSLQKWRCERYDRVLEGPRRIDWFVDQEIMQEIDSKLQMLTAACSDVDIKVSPFEDFGKGFIKKLRMSPDGFVQAALQVAHYKYTGKHCLTYEAAQTRLFSHGRTEAVRSCSVESSAFAKAMVDCPEMPPKEKFDLLQKCVDSHSAYMKDAMSGKGCDRHLMGLRILAAQMGIETPRIFLDKGASLPWLLSTSQTPSRIGPGGGFNPVSEDGFSVCYNVLEDKYFFHVVSKKSSSRTDSTEFATCLTNVMLEMHAMCLAARGDTGLLNAELEKVLSRVDDPRATVVSSYLQQRNEDQMSKLSFRDVPDGGDSSNKKQKTDQPSIGETLIKSAAKVGYVARGGS